MPFSANAVTAAHPVIVPVFVVVPPRVLLLDIAGPMEVLRKANLEQDALRFVVTYIGPLSAADSSIGLGVAGIAPLPFALPDGALVVVPGSVEDEDMALHGEMIVAWLRQAIRPGLRLLTICAGAPICPLWPWRGSLNTQRCFGAPKLNLLDPIAMSTL